MNVHVFYGNWTLIEKFQHTAWGMYSAFRGNQIRIVKYLDEILQTNYSKDFALNVALDNDNDELVDFFLVKNPNVYSWKPLFEYSCKHKSLKYANICIIDKEYKPNNEDFVFICSCGNIEWLQFIDLSKITSIDLSRGLGNAFKQKQFEMVLYLTRHSKVSYFSEAVYVEFDDFSWLLYHKVPVELLKQVENFNTFKQWHVKLLNFQKSCAILYLLIYLEFIKKFFFFTFFFQMSQPASLENWCRIRRLKLNVKELVKECDDTLIYMTELVIKYNLNQKLDWLISNFKSREHQKEFYEIGCFFGIVKLINLFIIKKCRDKSVWKPLFRYSCKFNDIKYANICINKNRYKPNNQDFSFVCENGNVNFLQYFNLTRLDNNVFSIGIYKAFKRKQFEMVLYSLLALEPM